VRAETQNSITKIAENPSGTPVRDLTISQGRLWAAMGPAGLWYADLSVPNITVPNVWQKASGTNSLPDGVYDFVCSTDDIVFSLYNDTIYKNNVGEPWVHAPFPYGEWTYLISHKRRVTACQKRFVGTLQPDSSYVEYVNNGTIVAAIPNEKSVYIGDATVGLQRAQPNSIWTVSPPGPKNNFVTSIAAGGGEMYIAARGKRGTSSRHYDKSGVPYYALHNEGWKLQDLRNGGLSADDVYQDFFRAIYDNNTGKCYMGSWGEGVVELENGEVVRTYSPSNSGMTSGTNDESKVGGLAMDEFGNLWIAHFDADIPLNVLTPEGQWISIDPPISMSPIGITVDNYNNKWIISQNNGLVVYNDNYTLDDPSDDLVMAINTNFGQGSLPNNSVFTVVQDKDEQIWIGTSEGVTILYDPSVLWTPDFQDAACPIIDGFCLLRDQQVNGIAVDGANRKWIATENGAYQVNEDGTILLQHFTIDNSPLLDNDVKTVEIDENTGEIFFGTAKGVISYMGDAIEGHQDAAELYVFPNPIAYEYEGVIMIKGMREKSKVKIANAAGEVLVELDSQGGEVPWDMRDAFGQRVRPGIYLVMVADANGEGAGIIKMAILERQN
ncbi:MAG: two-component regulator propeller domain-containing protein, partial [Bacteroidota bacterium]